ncbi:MAG: hypothetical protein KAH38_07495, partial [Candidatus Hydrogenedentes bacterium]|nr:hypothetical protein [Candidatus Hydrogenedentota bacterium]
MASSQSEKGLKVYVTAFTPKIIRILMGISLRYVSCDIIRAWQAQGLPYTLLKGGRLMIYRMALMMSLMVVMVGCVHGTGQRMIPVERDYGAVEEVTECEANKAVADAHAVGAGLFAPYEYDSAEHYLAWGDHEASEGDARGAWDFRGLAKMFAEEALAKGAGIPAKDPMPVPEHHEDCMAEFDRLVARYKELDPCKAKLIAPGSYAHIEAELSIAEHELMENCHFLQAFRHMLWVEADIDAIWAKDTDADGVTDMTDGEPWIAEDKDGFQDEDGIPEPKPYPV